MLADLLNEAAILAARLGLDSIGPAEIHNGWLKTALGTSRKRSMDERERSIIAAHEAGHAVCGFVHGDKRRVEEISLFAHGEALGVTVSSSEDNDLPSETDLRARLVALMGGRVAEELLFHEVTGGASSDFETATSIATSMVVRFGMGRDPEATDEGATGRGVLTTLVGETSVGFSRDVRDAQARAIRSILDEAYTSARRTLIAEMARLRDVAAYLYEQERIDGDEFEAIMAGRLRSADVDGWRAAAASPRPWDAIPTTFQERFPSLSARPPSPTGAGRAVRARPRARRRASPRPCRSARAPRRARAGAPAPRRPAPHRLPAVAGHARPACAAPWRRSCATSRPTRIADARGALERQTRGRCRRTTRLTAVAMLRLAPTTGRRALIGRDATTRRSPRRLHSGRTRTIETGTSKRYSDATTRVAHERQVEVGVPRRLTGARQPRPRPSPGRAIAATAEAVVAIQRRPASHPRGRRDLPAATPPPTGSRRAGSPWSVAPPDMP